MEKTSSIGVTAVQKLPMFIRYEYPLFTKFIETYYRFLEEKGEPYEFMANALKYADVDETSEELLSVFVNQFLSSLPNNIKDDNNTRTLIKNIEQFFSSKGNEDSVRFIFRLFDYKDDPKKDIDIYYPSKDMIRVSDGKWSKRITIKIKNPPENVFNWKSGEVLGLTSGAKAIIDDIEIYQSSSGIDIAEFSLIDFDVLHKTKKLIPKEELKFISLNNEVFTAKSEYVLHNIKIIDPGKYNKEFQRIRISSTSGEDAKGVIHSLKKGNITGFTIVKGGTGYKVNDKITVEQTGSGNGAYGYVTEVDGNGAITKVKLKYGGNNYKHVQKIHIRTENGSGALLFIESDTIGAVDQIDIKNFGIDYRKDTTEIKFNHAIRIYDVYHDFFVGERIIGEDSNTEGIIEYYKKGDEVISVKIDPNSTSQAFTPGERIIGQYYNGHAKIYDINIPIAEMEEGCLCSYFGVYDGRDGHLSSTKYLQDSYLYQVFSYLLLTTEPKEKWEEYLRDVHPAGTIGFSYNDIILNVERESYGGLLSTPHLDTIELYKFKWPHESYSVFPNSNTQILEFKDIPIDDVANVIDNKINKTGFTYGSEVTVI